MAGEGFFAAVDLDGVDVEFDSVAGEYELAGFADEEGFGAVSFATDLVGERGNGTACQLEADKAVTVVTTEEGQVKAAAGRLIAAPVCRKLVDPKGALVEDIEQRADGVLCQ